MRYCVDQPDPKIESSRGSLVALRFKKHPVLTKGPGVWQSIGLSANSN